MYYALSVQLLCTTLLPLQPTHVPSTVDGTRTGPSYEEKRVRIMTD